MRPTKDETRRDEKGQVRARVVQAQLLSNDCSCDGGGRLAPRPCAGLTSSMHPWVTTKLHTSFTVPCLRPRRLLPRVLLDLNLALVLPPARAVPLSERPSTSLCHDPAFDPARHLARYRASRPRSIAPCPASTLCTQTLHHGLKKEGPSQGAASSPQPVAAWLTCAGHYPRRQWSRQDELDEPICTEPPPQSTSLLPSGTGRDVEIPGRQRLYQVTRSTRSSAQATRRPSVPIS